MSSDAAKALAILVREALGLQSRQSKEGGVWRGLRGLLTRDAAWRWNFAVHARLFELAWEGRRPEEGPPAAWMPEPDELKRTNVDRLREKMGLRRYADLHRWSTENREAFEGDVLNSLGIVFRTPPSRIVDPASDPTAPRWLPGAQLNIA